MRQGLEQGLYGLEGLNPRAVSAAILATLNFATPLASWKDGFTGFASPLATDQWLMQDAASPMANTGTVGTETLANDSGLVNQTCPVIHDGTAYGNRACWESGATVANTDTLISSSTTAGNSNDEDFCFRIVFRGNSGAWAAGDYMLSKYATDGWLLYATGGRVNFTINDDTTSASVLAPGTIDNDIFDGCLHYLTGWYDKSADMLYIKGDLFTEVSADVSAVANTLTNAGSLQINAVNGAAATNGIAKLQVAYAGVCVGANAQAMYDEDFWQHAGDPSTLLTTQSRASLISVPLSSGAVGHFSDDTLPIGYNANFTDANKLGLYCNSAVTNLVPHSELLSNWTSSNVTETDNFADSPDGFKSATKLAATIFNGYSAGVFTSVASTQYTLSVMIKEITVGCTGRLILYDETGSAEIGATAFTCTSAWGQVVTLTATTAIGQISSSLRIEIDNNSAEMLAWGAQAALGSGRGAYVRTSGAAAALVGSDYRATGLTLTNLAALGEVKITWVPSRYGALGYLYDIAATSGTDNRRRMYRDSTTRLRYRIYDGVGASEDNSFVSTLVDDTEIVSRHVWDEAGTATGGFEQVLVFNGTTDEGAAVPWEGSVGTGDALTQISVGGLVGSGPLDAYIQKIEIRDGLSEVLP